MGFYRKGNGGQIVAARSYTKFGEVDSQGVELGLNYYVGDLIGRRGLLSVTFGWR